MNSYKAIGGYFELDLPQGDFLHGNAVLLNSGRSCFEYVLRANRPAKVYLPKFTCDAMLMPLQRLEIPFEFYRINPILEIADKVQLHADEMLVCNNYFGLKDEYCRRMSDEYGDRLIIDSSQAYYFEPPEASHSFYSPRKFFGVPDGGCLVTTKLLEEDIPVSTSHQRAAYLLRRIDEGAEAAYADFVHSEKSLDLTVMAKMSVLTKRLLGAIDFASAKALRLANYDNLAEFIGATNSFPVSLEKSACPMVYPYISTDPGLRGRLIERKIFVATYWPNVLKWSKSTEPEYLLATDLLPLPVDQRYDLADMKRIVEIIR